jgi:hypothetical protein
MRRKVHRSGSSSPTTDAEALREPEGPPSAGGKPNKGPAARKAARAVPESGRELADDVERDDPRDDNEGEARG